MKRIALVVSLILIGILMSSTALADGGTPVPPDMLERVLYPKPTAMVVL